MREWIGFDRSWRQRLRLFSDSKFQQRFLRLLREVRNNIEQRVLCGRTNVVDPFLGHAECHQFEFSKIIEQLRTWLCGTRRLNRLGHALRLEYLDLFDALANFNELHRASCRMAFDLAPL